MKLKATAASLLLLFFRLLAAQTPDGEDYQRGLALFDKAEYAQARTVFERLHSTLHRQADFNFYYGLSLLKTGRSEEALSAMKQAIELEPGNADYRYALGMIYGARMSELSLFRAAMLMGDAKSTLLKAVELDPRHVGATVALADFYLDVPSVVGGGKSGALPLLDRLQTLDPASADELRAKVEKNAGNPRRAEELYLQSVATPGSGAPVRLKLAKFYVDQKDYAKAIRYGEEYLRMARTWTDFSTDTTYAHLWLAISHHALGNQLEFQKHAQAVAGSKVPKRMREEIERRYKEAGIEGKG